MSLLRKQLLVVVVVGVFVGVAVPASAEDLEDYLEMAADAEYAGRRVVVTVWDGESHAEVTQVEHAGDVVMLGSGAGEAVIAPGKVTQAGGRGVAVAAWTAPLDSDKYSIGEVVDVTRMGRRARSVTILEGDAVRARIVFDLDTWAPLATEIYDGNGDLFRLASFTEFDAHPRRVYEATLDAGHDYDVVDRVDSSSLPISAGGYTRVDMYAGTDGVEQAFFSDGLFSFSVFEVTARQMRDGFEGGSVLEVGGADYVVLAQPSEVWVAWEHGAAAYVLVGDLPPDQLEGVLLDLPTPKRQNLLERIFGFFS